MVDELQYSYNLHAYAIFFNPYLTFLLFFLVTPYCMDFVDILLSFVDSW